MRTETQTSSFAPPHVFATPASFGRSTTPTPPLTVSFGQATFDAEGSESASRFFSRAIHWPGGASGVTIGRGYDMGQRTPLQVVSELTYAGVPQSDAQWLSRAAGLRGESARRFVDAERQYSPTLSPESQRKLFEVVTTTETIADIKRIMSKPDVVQKYGATSWSDLSKPVQEILFDLRYRGDYTPATREVLQPLIHANDLTGLAELMSDKAYWRERGVPRDRIERRIEIASGLWAREQVQ